VPRPKPPKLPSPAERADIAATAGDKRRDYAPALKALGIAAGDERAQDMLQQVAANDLVADAVKAEEPRARGRPQPWALFAMLDQLMGVADDLAPAAVRKRKHMWEFVNAFMVYAMGMKEPDVVENRSRAYKRLLPDLRRLAQQREATEQAKADAARWREIDKQRDQTDELLRKLRGLPPRGKPRLTRP
jgi:hypothetical protein